MTGPPGGAEGDACAAFLSAYLAMMSRPEGPCFRARQAQKVGGHRMRVVVHAQRALSRRCCRLRPTRTVSSISHLLQCQLERHLLRKPELVRVDGDMGFSSSAA